MSAPLIQRIAFRQLPPHQKSVLLALANYAREDGTGARPALATLAAWTGRSQVRTRVAVRELRRRGFIAVTRPHAQHQPAEYRLVLRAIEALPSTKQEPQQLDLFSPEIAGDSRFQQENAPDSSGNLRFPHSSTGPHRSPAISRAIAGDPRSVNRSVYRTISTARAREPKTGTR